MAINLLFLVTPNVMPSRYSNLRNNLFDLLMAHVNWLLLLSLVYADRHSFGFADVELLLCHLLV